jgi:hypothetical protein
MNKEMKEKEIISARERITPLDILHFAGLLIQYEKKDFLCIIHSSRMP